MEDFVIPCPSCGGTRFEEPEDGLETSLVSCVTCGFACTIGDLREHGTVLAKAQFAKEAKRMLEAEFKRIFK
jgi:hypothetical protein